MRHRGRRAGRRRRRCSRARAARAGRSSAAPRGSRRRSGSRRPALQGGLVVARADPLHRDDLLAGALSRLPIVSACRMPVVANDVRLLNVPSPTRWKVLLVEPCSPGHVPEAIVCQPTPVFGGKPWSMPFCPSTPFFISSRMVGMTLASAYFWTRSGRIPSAANMITVLTSGGAAFARFAPCFAAPAVPTATRRMATSAIAAAPSVLRFIVPLPFPPNDEPTCWFSLCCDRIPTSGYSKSHQVTMR